jgi:hypothetical protein
MENCRKHAGTSQGGGVALNHVPPLKSTPPFALGKISTNFASSPVSCHTPQLLSEPSRCRVLHIPRVTQIPAEVTVPVGMAGPYRPNKEAHEEQERQDLACEGQCNPSLSRKSTKIRLVSKLIKARLCQAVSHPAPQACACITWAHVREVHQRSTQKRRGPRSAACTRSLMQPAPTPQSSQGNATLSQTDLV